VKRMDGVAIGLVTDVDAKLARVKVSFPWMDPPQDSYWAPIASDLSGKKRGLRFMPEIDDEALVAFDRGDFGHPYVVGFLWNGKDEAPDDVKTNRLIVTPGGHELRFEDKQGDRRVVLKTADAHKLTLDDKAKSVTLESTKGHKLEILDNDGKVTLATKSGGTITLENQPGKVVVEASQNKITLGPDGITIEVSAGTLNVKSSGVTNVEASGMMNVKSSAAMTIQSSAVMNITSTAAMTIQSSAAMNVTAGGVVTLTAAMLSVNAAMATFSGVVQASTVISSTVVTSSVVSSTYTPGVGNLI
jgi:uncharacterized protein involved in type VI secretion and phage assembly